MKISRQLICPYALIMTHDLPKFQAAVEAGYRRGLHIGINLSVILDGKSVINQAFGAASLQPFTPLESRHKMLWLSAGKPLTAMAIALLEEKGQLSLSDQVSRHIPEFATNGKEAITIAHLLTHTHGLHGLMIDWSRLSWDEVVFQFCHGRMAHEPGTYAAYDPQNGWLILAEIVRRVSGIPNHEFVQKYVLAPCGITESSIGMPAEEWTRLAESGELVPLTDCTRTAQSRIDLAPFVRGESASAPETGLPGRWSGDTALRAPAHNPGGGSVGPAEDLAKFYQCLLQEGASKTQVFRPETVAKFTARQRTGMTDNSFRQIIDWGYGFLLNSAHYGTSHPYGYGKYAGKDTFGHGGMQSTAGFADPQNRLAVAMICNGLPGEAKHSHRLGELISALYEDLSLVNA